MSGNELGVLCDEQKMLEYIYDDVDDSDIFATEPLNDNFAESDPRSVADLPSEPITVQNPEIYKENESLKETVERLLKEREIYQLRISELYKTAKAELERKDRRLKDLEKERDNIVFRRGNNALRNKPFDVDTRVPVLQQIEIDLTNEEFQNFNTRYRIPKKNITPFENNDTSKTSTKNKELPKNVNEERLVNKNTHKENDGNNERHWTAYPYLKDKASNKEFKDRRLLAETEPRDRIVRGRSRVQERFDSSKTTNRENNTSRLSPYENLSPSGEGYRQKFVQRSKSSSRYTCGSSENCTSNRPSSPYGETKQELPYKRGRSKSVNEPKDKNCWDGIPTSTKKEQVGLSRRRSRSPSDENNSQNNQSIQSINKALGRYQPGSPEYRIRQPRTQSVERDHSELPKELIKSKEYIKIRNNSVEEVEPKDRRYSDQTSKEKDRSHLTSRRSRSPSDKNNTINKKSVERRSKSSGRHKPSSPECRIRQPRSPSVEREHKLTKESVRSRPKDKYVKIIDQSVKEDVKPKDNRYRCTSRDRSNVNVHLSRGRSRSPSEENKNKKSVHSRSKSLSRYQPAFPERRIRQPRTPSTEKEQEEVPKDLKRSTSKDKVIKIGNNRIPCTSTSLEQENVSGKTTLSYKEITHSRIDKGSLEEDKDDFRRKVNKVERDNYINVKSIDKDVIGSRTNRKSFRDKGSGSDFKDRKNKDKDSRSRREHSNYREKHLKSRSISRERYVGKQGFRRSRSTSKERHLREPQEKHKENQRENNRNARTGRYFQRDKSRSSSVERDGREKFRHRADSPVRRDRHGNVIDYKYRRDRSKSRSKDKPSTLIARGFENRDRKSRAKDFSGLRERLLRYSIDREKQDLRNASRGGKNLIQNNQQINDKKKTPIINETDHSDLDDLKLHLSGESDLESLTVENPNEQRHTDSGDNGLKMLFELGVDPLSITDDQLERLLEKRKEICNQVYGLHDAHNKITDEDHDYSDVEEQFSVSEGELIHSDEYNDNKQVQRKNIDIWHPPNEEELDYEESQHEFMNNCNKEIKNLEPKVETLRKTSKDSTRIVQQVKEKHMIDTYVEKVKKFDSGEKWPVADNIDLQEECEETKCSDYGQKQFKTIFGLRQHQKLMKTQIDVKSTEPSKIIRSSTQVLPKEEKNSYSVQETHKKQRSGISGNEIRNQTLISEKKEPRITKSKDVHETNKETPDNGQKLTKGRDKYNHMFKDIDNLKQECKELGQLCSSTRVEITANFKSKVANNVDLNEKCATGDSILLNVEVKKEDEHQLKIKNEEKEIEQVVSKRREKITLNAYKSRRQSTDTKIKVKESDNATDVSEKGQSKTNVPTQDGQKIKTDNENIDKLPLSEDDVPENSKNDVVKIESKMLIQNTDTNTDEVVKGQEYADLHNNNPKQNESNIPTKTQDLIQINQEDDAFKDPDSFLRDFSISDDEDHVEENVTPGNEEQQTESDNKIKIISDIIIQSPSYTPPHPKHSISTLQTSENLPKDINFEIKDSNTIKRRKSLFTSFEDNKETLDAVKNIPSVEDKLVSDSTAENTLQISENIPQISKIGTEKAGSILHSEDAESIEVIQEAVKNRNTSVGSSASSISNTITEQFDREQLQKCLEEDIGKPKSKIVDCINTGTEKAVLPSKTHAKVTSIKRSDDDVDKRRKRKREHKKKENIEAVTPSEENMVELNNKKMIDLFGPMTPSPCKATEQILEENVNRDKAKRMIEICEETNSENRSFRIRDRNEATNKKDLKVKINIKNILIAERDKMRTDLNSKVNIKDNKITEEDNIRNDLTSKVNNKDNQNAKKANTKTRRKSFVEKCGETEKIQGIIIIQPEDVEKCPELKERVEEKKVKMGLSIFCSNPTYIPNIRDTPKAVFESPNHYIQKKNQELKQKVKRNLNENPLESEKIFQQTNSDSNKHCMKEKSSDALKSVDFIENPIEKCPKVGKGIKKTRYKIQKEEKNKNVNEECNEDESNKQKVTVKHTKKNGKKQNDEGNEKVTTKQSKQNPAFKIKINRPRKRQRNGTKENICDRKTKVPDSEEGSDSSEENPNSKKQTVKKKESIKDAVTDKKLSSNEPEENPTSKNQEVEEKELFKDTINKEDLSRSESEENPKSKKQKVEEKERIQVSIVIEAPSLSPSDSKQIDNTDKIKSKRLKIDKIENKSRSKEIKHKKLMKSDYKSEERNEKNYQEIKESTKLKEQKGSCQENIEIKEDSQKGTTTSKENTKTSKQILNTNDKCAGIGERSIENNSNISTCNDSTQEPVKPRKRITPKRIDDSSFKKEKEQIIKDLKAKRELFSEDSNFEFSSAKRRRLSCDEEDCRSEKYQKITYTESRRTVEEDVIDNGAHTHIKLQETHLNIEVAPNSSPLPRIEQTYDMLSRSNALNKDDNPALSDSRFIDATNPQLQPTHEGVFPDIRVTIDTLPEINLDTKDLLMLGPNEKEIFLNLSDYSISDKSMVVLVSESKIKSDKESGEIGVVGDGKLSFTNFLNYTNPNTSTPIKNRVITSASVPKCLPVTEAYSKRDGNIVHKSNNPPNMGSSNKPDVTSKSLSSSLGNNTLTTVCSRPQQNTNISGENTSSEITNNVSNGSSVSRTDVKFSCRTLKRDRRRPISIMVID